ncbi:riboflavin kinase isoform X2 [Temnothorax longispinosus]|uniref:riboflavin kinase isoform X2 n=1 Tax=Temnothorax longispinosus TaxID=300112 RepID=UPI003A998188
MPRHVINCRWRLSRGRFPRLVPNGVARVCAWNDDAWTTTDESSIMGSKILPCFVSGVIVKGFGRGSKALGIPTANLPESVVSALPEDLSTGIYYGWASLHGGIYKMVASIGWNPYYKNEKKSMEVHLLHKFQDDFYGEKLRVIIAGYIRPERDFSSLGNMKYV